MPKLRVHNFAVSMPRAGADVRLGGGERLFDTLDDGAEGCKCDELVCSPAVAHARVSRR